MCAKYASASTRYRFVGPTAARVHGQIQPREGRPTLVPVESVRSAKSCSRLLTPLRASARAGRFGKRQVISD